MAKKKKVNVPEGDPIKGS